MGRPRSSMRRYDVLAALQQDERASLRELCATCEIRSTSQVYVLLKELEEEGLIRRKAGARQVFLTGAGREFHWEMAKPARRRVAIRRSHQERGEVSLPRLSRKEQAARIERVVEKAVSGQRSEIGGQRSAVSGQRSAGSGQPVHVRGWKVG